MFTEKQIDDYRKYEKVRLSGRINMYDSYHGSRLAGLTEYEYMFVLTNYEDLRMEAENQS